ncbi:MAG: hypothetical protein C5B50_24980 [Verrucomicrobia bacterium]|nr:MAG: hypothetical protein C5B50_24980 [Verrucomicrobiota bacterium]
MQKKSLETILYSTAGIVVMLVIIIAINFIVGASHARLDLTQEKAYTLSAGTKAILRQIKDLDTPVTLRFYFTQAESATPESVFLKGYAQRVEDLISEYKMIAGSKLKVEKYDPQPDSDAEDTARLDAIEAKQLPGLERVYFGISVKCADEAQTLPFLDPDRERLLEYDLSRAISRAIKPEKPTVGIMSALPIFGAPSNPMMMQMGQQGSEPWTLVTELKNDFNVKRVEMETDKIPDDVHLLLVIHPKEISDKAQYAIDQFIMRGGKLVAYLDAQCVADRGRGNQMMQAMGGGGSSLDKLLKAWGVEFDTGKVVADMRYKMRVGRGENGEPEDQPAWLGLTVAQKGEAGAAKADHPAISRDDVATSQINNVWVPLCGAFTGTPKDGLKETVLLESSTDSQLVDAMLANISAQNITKEFKPSGVNYKLGIRLTGKFKTAFPNGKPEDKKDDKAAADKKDEKKVDDSLKECKTDNAVVLFGDADMLYDPFTVRKIGTPFGQFATLMNANLTLAQNVVEQMSGDSNLIAVRSRATISRPFDKVLADKEKKARERYQAEINRLEESKNEAQRKISEMQSQKKDKNQQFILSPEQQAELVKLQKDAGETGKRVRQLQKDLHKEILGFETWTKWVNILVVPFAVTLSGITIAVVKRRKTAAK